MPCHRWQGQFSAELAVAHLYNPAFRPLDSRLYASNICRNFGGLSKARAAATTFLTLLSRLSTPTITY